MSEFVETEVEVVEELAHGTVWLAAQIEMLANFLVVNFGDEARDEGIVERAMRLLTELREQRRGALKLLDTARAELERRRQRIEILTAELVEANRWIGLLRKEGCTGRRTDG